jgi:hypothetical protein
MRSSVVPPEGEHLTTGWEPDLPPEDTLVRQAVLVHASWPVAVAGAAGRPWQSSERWAGGWIGDRGALTNPVVLTQPLTHVEDVLGEIGALIPPSVPYLLLSPWPTADLQEHGLVLIGHPPLMVRFPAPPTTPLPRWSGEVREIVLQRGSGTPSITTGVSHNYCTNAAQVQPTVRKCSAS